MFFLLAFRPSKKNPGFSSAPAFQNSCRINFFFFLIKKTYGKKCELSICSVSRTKMLCLLCFLRCSKERKKNIKPHAAFTFTKCSDEKPGICLFGLKRLVLCMLRNFRTKIYIIVMFALYAIL